MIRRTLAMALFLACAPAATAAAAGRAATDVADSESPAAGMFLVARRDMPDRRFRHAVILLVGHDADGTLGLVVNNRSRARLQDVVPDLEVVIRHDYPVFVGGPVGISGIMFLVRHGRKPPSSVHVLDDIYMSGDEQTLIRMLGEGKSPERLRIYLGYAGWGPGQLDGEILRGDWHLHPAAAEQVFTSDPSGLWDALINAYEPQGQMVRWHRGTGTPRPEPTTRFFPSAAHPAHSRPVSPRVRYEP